MDTTDFCGQACHSVMAPEHTAYQRGAHASVRCVDCHIGPGAGWFVKSKLSGSWQLVSVALDLYPTPDPDAGPQPAPGARHLRAVPLAAEVRRRQAQGARPSYEDDEANTELKTVLLMRVGGIAGPRLAGDPLARRSGATGSATAPTRPARRSGRSNAPTAPEQGRALARGRRQEGEKATGGRLARDGLRRLPQPAEPHLPHARGGGRQGDPRGADRARPAVCPPRRVSG